MKTSNVLNLLAIYTITAFLGAGLNAVRPGELDDLGLMIKSQSEAEQPRITDPGRRFMNDLMIKSPEQLSKDITRLGVLNVIAKSEHLLIRNKTKKITAADVAGKSTLEIFDMLKDALVEAVTAFPQKDQKPFYDERAQQRIGGFLITEILYGLAQTFANLAFGQTQMKNMELATTWIASKDDTTNESEIVYSPKSQTITVSMITKRSLQDLSGESTARRPLEIVNSAMYNLATGALTYAYSYTYQKRKNDFGPFTTLELPR